MGAGRRREERCQQEESHHPEGSGTLVSGGHPWVLGHLNVSSGMRARTVWESPRPHTQSQR